MSDELLISTSDIAELADERLPVISTWRSRYKDGDNAFPEPAGGTPARPLFAFEAVSAWVSRNRPEKNLQERLLPVRIWSVIRALTTNGVEPFGPVHWVHLVLAARKAELEPRLRVAVGEPRANASELTDDAAATITRLIEQADPAELVTVSDFILTRLSAGYGRRGGDIGAVGSAAAGILGFASISRTVTATGEIVIYDPSCGIGEALIEVARMTHDGHPMRVFGTEINPRVADIARVRLALRDIPAEISTADTLASREFADVSADVVVSEPPMGIRWAGVWAGDDPRARFGVPPLRAADLAWVADAAVRLADRGRGFVLTSTAALGRGGAEEKIRAALVKAGAVEVVIALPPNLLQYTSMSLALWVLRAPRDDGLFRYVHMVDASDPDIDDSTDGRTEWIKRQLPSWIIDPDDVDPVHGIRSAMVGFHELVEAGMDLTPTRWIDDVGNTAVRDHLESVSNMFSFRLEQFPREAPYFEGLPSTPHIVTIREITELGASREAKLWAGRGASNEEAADDTITSRDLAEYRLRAVTERTDGPGIRTESGDVVFTTVTRVRAMVDTDGGHRLGNGVYALRLDAESRFEPEYVAMCLRARWNERHQKGATIKHAKPADLEIPLLPLEGQRAWVAAFADLRKIQKEAESLASIADEVETAAYNALRYGHQDDAD